MKFNPTIATDAYKITHWLQRPKNMTKFYNYGELVKEVNIMKLYFLVLIISSKNTLLVKLQKKTLKKDIVIHYLVLDSITIFQKKFGKKLESLDIFHSV